MNNKTKIHAVLFDGLVKSLRKTSIRTNSHKRNENNATIMINAINFIV